MAHTRHSWISKAACTRPRARVPTCTHARTHRPISNTYSFATAKFNRESASVSRYTCIGYLVSYEYAIHDSTEYFNVKTYILVRNKPYTAEQQVLKMLSLYFSDTKISNTSSGEQVPNSGFFVEEVSTMTKCYFRKKNIG
jgi:hypothetical protein